jgi:O-acetyl-ADP-ribose deacetylase
MINERVDHFSFWQPVVFTLDDNPGITPSSRLAYTIGSLADQFASLSQKTISVDADRINARKLYFEVKEIKDIPLWDTALKISLYILSAGTLLLVALTVKAIFKYHLNNCKVLTKRSPNEVFAEKLINKTKIVLLYGSITDETTDAIVNAANARLLAGGGVCGVIHGNAGDLPFDECEEILKGQKRPKLDCGETALTSSGDLAPTIKAIVHAVGPDYRKKKEKANGSKLLTATYRNSLEIAHDSKSLSDYVSKSMQGKTLHSIAFPSISTGIFEAPLDEAAPIAMQTVKEFIEEFPDAFEEVRFVFLPLKKDANTAPAYQKALDELE